ncbi:CAP domain-containing protein [Micromonospora sp. M12]
MRDGFSDRTNDEFLQEVLTKVNELRARHGSSPLTLDPELVEYAKSRAAFMAEKDNLTHEGLRSGTGENASKSSASSGPQPPRGPPPSRAGTPSTATTTTPRARRSTPISPSGTSLHWSGGAPRQSVWGASPARAGSGGTPTSWRTSRRPGTWEAST